MEVRRGIGGISMGDMGAVLLGSQYCDPCSGSCILLVRCQYAAQLAVCDRSAGPWHQDSAASLWKMPDSSNVLMWRDKVYNVSCCHYQPGHGSQPKLVFLSLCNW